MKDIVVRLSDGADITLRRAESKDLPSIVDLLADDPLGSTREGADGGYGPYERAFEEISADSRQLLVVAVDEQEIVGTLQLTVIPGLSRRGARRAQIEGVRVSQRYRSRGLGAAIIQSIGVVLPAIGDGKDISPSGLGNLIRYSLGAGKLARFGAGFARDWSRRALEDGGALADRTRAQWGSDPWAIAARVPVCTLRNVAVGRAAFLSHRVELNAWMLRNHLLITRARSMFVLQCICTAYGYTTLHFPLLNDTSQILPRVLMHQRQTYS